MYREIENCKIHILFTFKNFLDITIKSHTKANLRDDSDGTA